MCKNDYFPENRGFCGISQTPETPTGSNNSYLMALMHGNKRVKTKKSLIKVKIK